MNLLKQYIKQIIAESITQDSNLAAFLYTINYNEKSVVLYDASEILSNIELIESLIKNAQFRTEISAEQKKLREFFRKSIVKGMVTIAPPSGPCNGAWEVISIAGPGYGPLLQDIAFAISPTGKLIADRVDITDKGLNSINRSASQNNRQKKALDDIQHRHNIPGNEFHTDDPSDDCKIQFPAQGRDTQHLNYSYEATGEEINKTQHLFSNHTSLFNSLSQDLQKELKNALDIASDEFFRWAVYSSQKK